MILVKPMFPVGGTAGAGAPGPTTPGGTTNSPGGGAPVALAPGSSSGTRPFIGQLALVPKPATVWGHILTDGRPALPIPSALVVVGTLQVRTDPKGAFTIPNVPPGSYTMTVTAAGYAMGTRNVKLDPGGVAQADLTLHKGPGGTATPVMPLRIPGGTLKP